jgi:hypothetical protein
MLSQSLPSIVISTLRTAEPRAVDDSERYPPFLPTVNLSPTLSRIILDFESHSTEPPAKVSRIRFFSVFSVSPW